MLQAIGLVAQPTEVQEVIAHTDMLMEWCEFGEYYEGRHTVWTWNFAVEHTDVFARGDNPVARLEELFEQVPVVCGLEETAGFMLPIFYPYGAIKNIYFKKN